MTATALQQPADFQRDLLAWYHANRRQLPWREEPSLYRTVVSEFMLQQTQIKTALPYFHRWMEALPDFAALAAADEATVLKLWEGLGYYSRARNLQRLARAYVALPEPPTTPDAWRALPGIGPYTSAAITSIALGYPAACVDGNVVRILARLTADGTSYRDSATAAKAYTPLAESVLNRDEPGDHNQAMMELGATVCHRRSPLCTICPVRKHCAACAAGAPEEFPKLEPKKIERIAITRAWCERDGALLLHRASAKSRRLANLHELPDASTLGLPTAAVVAAPVLAVKKRGITRYAITETIVRLDAPATVDANAELVWVPRDQLDDVTLSGPHRKWITALLANT
ncbi:A/G-specific adenine glycosylase [Actomonas aquatica]|uniref:Adenine DNA glycosylase n=1 Tax=Actomonas aquatica TaxID=2866162 RepID=A0ABZ1C8I6_9BACT|nr:A/G-specific adenine glycosylase [Opitutus sp. WL0086]WRQ87578.1 A/G-specific adenine glycosylase [Opitutus sp. WL0086]